MADLTYSFKDGFDVLEWRPVHSVVYSASSITNNSAGFWIAEDFRNKDYASPMFYYPTNTSTLNAFYTRGSAWGNINTSFGAGGSFGVGVSAVFVPSLGPKGRLATGATPTSVVLSTALPASVGVNQLANRGDGKGFIIRIIGNGSGNSGKIEERRIIGNTSGTTPTIYLEEALSFTPGNTNADSYELLSGSLLVLNTGALTANQFRRYDVATQSTSSLSTTSLIATVPATGNFLIATDESYVPHDRQVGEGFLIGAATYDASNTLLHIKRCLTATATAAGTLTGQAASGDAGIVANQYRNYQIRIVEDTTTPTAVGQRRRITSHTAGASPVYTLNTNWTVTPSSTCKFVIENWTDNIIGFMGGTTTIYNYTHTSFTGVATVDTWDTTTWAARGSSGQTSGAFGFYAFGVQSAAGNTVKSSNIFCLRGGSTTYDILDIAGAATGSWTNGSVMIDAGTGAHDGPLASTDLSNMAYNPHTQKGRYCYWSPASGTSAGAYIKPFHRLDCISGRLERVNGMRVPMGNNAMASGAKSAFVTLYQDSTTKVAMYHALRPLASDYWVTPLLR